MNGIAGSFHTNTHNIPIQVMRKLTSMQSTDSSLWPSEFQNEFSSLLHEHKKGTLSDFSFLDKNEIKPLRPIFQKVFDEIELERIHQVLHTTMMTTTTTTLCGCTNTLMQLSMGPSN